MEKELQTFLLVYDFLISFDFPSFEVKAALFGELLFLGGDVRFVV